MDALYLVYGLACVRLRSCVCVCARVCAVLPLYLADTQMRALACKWTQDGDPKMATPSRMCIVAFVLVCVHAMRGRDPEVPLPSNDIFALARKRNAVMTSRGASGHTCRVAHKAALARDVSH